MNKQTVSLRGLRTFCVAARHESFREAAERMFVTASAVSHQIKNLEDELGLRLFDRTARQLRLTDAGRLLFEDVSPLIEQLDLQVSRHRAQAPRSSLNISVQPFFASELFVPRLPEFTGQHPDIEITIDTSDESPEKHAGSVDASIRVFKSPPAGLNSERLFPLRLIPAGSPSFRDGLKLKGRKISSEFPLIVHEGRPKAWKQWSNIAGYTLPENAKKIRLASMIAIVRAAERGLGAALVPLELSDAWFKGGSLVPLFDKPLETADAYYFVTDNDKKETDNVRALREWTVATFSDVAIAKAS